MSILTVSAMQPDKATIGHRHQLPCLAETTALSWRLTNLLVSGALLVTLTIASTLVSAAGEFSAVEGTGVSRQPTRMERHQELRRVLTTPDEFVAPRDERRRLSVDERDTLRRELRESMRDVYDERRVKRR